jgi:hypothetical protein
MHGMVGKMQLAIRQLVDHARLDERLSIAMYAFDIAPNAPR